MTKKKIAPPKPIDWKGLGRAWDKEQLRRSMNRQIVITAVQWFCLGLILGAVLMYGMTGGL